MQNLLSILGSAPAVTAYLALCQSPTRSPVFRIEALNEDLTVALDLSPYLKSASVDTTDDLKSHLTNYVFLNPANGDGVAMFDLFGTATTADILRRDRIIRYKKGLKDPATGIEYLIPAAYGRITQATPQYNPSGEQTISITCADEFKHPVKQRITTRKYRNSLVNSIASELLTRYGKFDLSRINLAPLDRTFGFAQFPDFVLTEALQTLYDPSLYSVRADEAGNVTTAPRLGSPTYGFGLMGYPDQSTEPNPDLVSYTIPDGVPVLAIGEQWQDYDGAYNQVRVYGRATASVQTLGPIKLLYQETDNAIGRTDKRVARLNFQQGTSSGSTIVAKNPFIRLDYYTNADNPRFIYLSTLPWRGVWDAGQIYTIGDGVEFDTGGVMTAYICSKDASGAGQAPGNTLYWQSTGITRDGDGNYPLNILEASAFGGIISSTDLPWWSSVRIWNEDPRFVGFVEIVAVTSAYVTLRIEGRSYSTNSARRGGFNYGLSLYGQPQVSRSRTITAYSDYNPVSVTEEILTEPFGDALTYQAEHQPFALSIPVEVFKDGVSLGVVTADQTDLSGDLQFGADFERGRIALKDLAYQNFESDSASDHPYSSGGSAESTAETFSTDFLSPNVPQTVLQTRRDGDTTYTFDGLTVGAGYDLRLTFADPTSTAVNQRKFSVYAQGEKVLEGYDIYTQTRRARAAYQETLSGIAPDVDGKIILIITQHDPLTGNLLQECQGVDNFGNPNGSPLGTAIVSAIEVLNPMGETATAEIAVNAGGDTYTATHPVITCSYGYSPVQETYQAQQFAVDNPLLATQEECQDMADWYCNHLQWSQNRFTVRVPSVPHLQPGDLLRLYHPRIKADCWMYLPAIKRDLSAPGSDGTGGTDDDTYTGYLLYKAAR